MLESNEKGLSMTTRTSPRPLVMTTRATRSAATPRRYPGHRVLAALLSSPLRAAVPGELALLEYRTGSGAVVVLPVHAVAFRDGYLVLAGRAAAKTWWRAFRGRRPARLLRSGQWVPVTGGLLGGDDPLAGAAAAAYTAAHPRAQTEGARIVYFVCAKELRGSGPDAVRRWVRWTIAGELVGFLAPAFMGVVSAGWASSRAIPSLMGAGAVEGLLLGAAQAHALEPSVPGLRPRLFAIGTAVAAALAYLIGMLPSTLATNLSAAPRAVLVVAGAVGGVILLASIGTAQWWELRHHVTRAWTWIVTTAVAWVAGLFAFLLIAMPLWQPDQPWGLAVLIGLLAAVAMATTVALITGQALQRLLRRGLGQT